MKALLVEGLSQAAVDCHLPSLIVRKSLKHFLDDDLDSLDSHNKDSIRLIAHPYSVDSEKPMPAFELFTSPLFFAKKEVVLAIGPEGGWEEGEVKAFVERGFKVVSLGERILRTDIAVSTLTLHATR
jgi:RsmE family RNA methyltransferase